MKKHLTDFVLQKIKKEHIQPHSKWYFFLRTLLLGGGGMFFFLLGTLASAIIFHFINFNESFDFIAQSPPTFFKLFWLGLPLVWIGITLAGGILALYFSRKTKKGYKIPLLVWGILIFIPQVVVGFFLEQSHIGERADEMIAHHMSFYTSIHQRRHNLWSQPRDGFLAGTILEIKNDTFLILDDFKNQKWNVDYSRTKKRGRQNILVGEKIKMIGKKISDRVFYADRIGPWRDGHWKRHFGSPPPFSRRQSRKIPFPINHHPPFHEH
jgi:hypothetical protein